MKINRFSSLMNPNNKFGSFSPLRIVLKLKMKNKICTKDSKQARVEGSDALNQRRPTCFPNRQNYSKFPGPQRQPTTNLKPGKRW